LKRNESGGATMLKAVVDGAVELYHDNTKKFETTSAGVTVAGALITAAKGIASASLPAGSVVQIVSVTKVDTFTYTGSTNFQNLTGLAAAITPKASANKILIQVNLNLSSDIRYAAAILKRGSTHVGGGTAASSRPSVSISSSSNPDNTNSEYVMHNSSFSFLDSPNTTSGTTYQVQVGNTNSADATLYVNRHENDSDANYAHRGSSTITLTELVG